jgi:hypothetical protein
MEAERVSTVGSFVCSHKLEANSLGEDPSFIEAKVAAQIKSLLGNRLISTNSGGTSVSPFLIKFFHDKLGIKLPDLYGYLFPLRITNDWEFLFIYFPMFVFILMLV